MPARALDDKYERFRVEPWVDWFGGVAARHRGLFRRLGDFETRRLGSALDGVEIRAPIFICGLARSGTTILLECLSQHPDTVTHRYRDYPGVLAPVFWDQVSQRLYANKSQPTERAHGDGIAVTSESPEAIEEMIWMAFHPRSHDTAYDNSISRNGVTPEFAAFYREHIRKLLWLRQGKRYLSKGNYNLSRLGALIELFPDAHFIVPVRDPISHIASLQRQHGHFCAAEARHPAALRYLQRVGHFEFGLDRRPLNLGNADTTRAVQDLWNEGREVEGWSYYWAAVHDFLADRLEEDLAVRQATLLVPFENLCADPVGMLGRVLAHAHLPAGEAWLRTLAQRIHAPADRVVFSESERQTIRRLTASAATRVGMTAP